MKGAAKRGFVAVLTGLSIVVVASAKGHAQPPTPAAKVLQVTDQDRVFRNFTRESAVVDQGQIRVEVRALRTEELGDGDPAGCSNPNRKNCARLNTIGQRVLGVEEVKGASIDLVASYGLIKNTEVGFIIPMIIETVQRDDGSKDTNEDFGDLLFYGKYRQPIMDNWTATGGLEITAPTGDDQETRTLPRRFASNGSAAGRGFSAFGTDEVGLNPFVSTRYHWGRVAIGGHLGYNFFTGDNVPDVFNYGTESIIRLTDMFAFRTEISSRVFDQFGTKWHDVVMLPGLDVKLSDNFTIRPEGMAGLTGTAQDWGIGLGIAGVF